MQIVFFTLFRKSLETNFCQQHTPHRRVTTLRRHHTEASPHSRHHTEESPHSQMRHHTCRGVNSFRRPHRRFLNMYLCLKTNTCKHFIHQYRSQYNSLLLHACVYSKILAKHVNSSPYNIIKISYTEYSRQYCLSI